MMLFQTILWLKINERQRLEDDMKLCEAILNGFDNTMLIMGRIAKEQTERNRGMCKKLVNIDAFKKKKSSHYEHSQQ